MPQTDLIQQFCHHLLTQKRYSPNTVSSYQNDLTGLAGYISEEYELEDMALVSSQILKSWLSSLKGSGMEARSINRKLSACKSFYKYLLREGAVGKSPANGIRSMKIKKNLPVFVEEARLAPVMDREFFPQGFDGDSHFLIFQLFYLTGMRVSELVTLREADVRPAAGIITVLGKGNKQRNIPADTRLVEYIRAYISEKRKLFATPGETLLVTARNEAYSRAAVYRVVRQTLAEITTISKKSPHVLRHSFATHLSDHGAPIGAIKDLLGHSSLAATQVYTHTSIARLKEIYKKTHPKS